MRRTSRCGRATGAAVIARDAPAAYAKAFELLRGAAATDPDATALIQRVAGSLR